LLSSESRNLLPGGGADIAKELASSGQLMDTVFGVCPPHSLPPVYEEIETNHVTGDRIF
tara:strand:+ start:213 stop:389 length:177 start_codon:yes stop_codon:yes gene_type:complete